MTAKTRNWFVKDLHNYTSEFLIEIILDLKKDFDDLQGAYEIALDEINKLREAEKHKAKEIFDDLDDCFPKDFKISPYCDRIEEVKKKHLKGSEKMRIVDEGKIVCHKIIHNACMEDVKRQKAIMIFDDLDDCFPKVNDLRISPYWDRIQEVKKKHCKELRE